MTGTNVEGLSLHVARGKHFAGAKELKFIRDDIKMKIS